MRHVTMAMLIQDALEGFNGLLTAGSDATGCRITKIDEVPSFNGLLTAGSDATPLR